RTRGSTCDRHADEPRPAPRRAGNGASELSTMLCRTMSGRTTWNTTADAGGLTMKSCKMRVPGYDARAQRGWIRWELFVHDEVRDVLPTPRDDILCVVYRGEPDPDGRTA